MTGRSKDLERFPTKVYDSGYPTVAAFIASDKDSSSAIYRKYERLSARNLLNLENEIAQLQAEQDQQDVEDERRAQLGDIEAAESLERWEYIQSSSNGSRQELATKIRLKLKEYHEALVLESQVLSLQQPDPYVLQAFRKWMNKEDDPDIRRRLPRLGGLSSERFEDKNDLCALRTPADPDRLSRFFLHHLGFLFPSGSVDGRLAYTSESKVTLAVAIISILLAAGLLIGAVISLYLTNSATARLWKIAGFTLAFAISVGLFTNARRVETFAATAAYTAVLVVFVSGNLGNAGTGSG